MDAKSIIYGETSIQALLKWLRVVGEPRDVRIVVQRYLELLRQHVLEGNE